VALAAGALARDGLVFNEVLREHLFRRLHVAAPQTSSPNRRATTLFVAVPLGCASPARPAGRSALGGGDDVMRSMASRMSPPPVSIISMYRPPQTMRSARTPKIVTPLISSRLPSVRVPCQPHSAQTLSPSTAERISSARKSGTPWKIACQFSRTCSQPPNARSGCAGCSLR
jgi:hypothetical protein